MSRGNIVATGYNLRVVVAMFLEEENQVHDEHFVSKLVYLSNIFEKFNTLNTSLQGNNTDIIVVTDKV
jgi:hypothetical protein